MPASKSDQVFPTEQPRTVPIALTVSFTDLTSGQLVVDEFFWRRQLLITLKRDSEY